MDKVLLLSTVYLLGYALAHAMLRVEHQAEGHTYTKGDRLLTYALSLFSWGVIGWLLVSCWYGRIKALGYWDQPVKVVKKEAAK